jgi:TetR/AcrR family transcriptional repressor of nem operon
MDTRDLLIGQATRLIRGAGYSGFSYADLSEIVGFKKASIHHHFPSKRDLGLATVETYRQSLVGQLQEIWQLESSCENRLKRYANLYRDAVKEGNGCLCGVLAAEFSTLPPPMQEVVHRFFEDNSDWLEAVLLDNSSSDRQSRRNARKRAELIHATLQGALLICRVTRNVKLFDSTARSAISLANPM